MSGMRGAYARDKNTSARLCAKNAVGLMREGGGAYLQDTTVHKKHNHMCLGFTY